MSPPGRFCCKSPLRRTVRSHAAPPIASHVVRRIPRARSAIPRRRRPPARDEALRRPPPRNGCDNRLTPRRAHRIDTPPTGGGLFGGSKRMRRVRYLADYDASSEVESTPERVCGPAIPSQTRAPAGKWHRARTTAWDHQVQRSVIGAVCRFVALCRMINPGKTTMTSKRRKQASAQTEKRPITTD